MIESRAISLVTVEYDGSISLGVESKIEVPTGTYLLGLQALEIETEAKTEEELGTWGVSGLSLGGVAGEGLTILVGPARLLNVSPVPPSH